jgi:CO/xanthine dehydrogenase Mo-binding subunit
MRPANDVPECCEPERFELREPPAYEFGCDRRGFLEFAGAGLLIMVFAPVVEGQRRRGNETATLGARLHLGEDGVVTILTGKIEEGQGPRTELALAAAEELRVPIERVRMMMADTDVTPNDGTTAGSGTTPRAVPSVRRAAATARELLLSAASEQWRADRTQLQMRDGMVTSPDGARKLTYGDLAKSPGLAAAYKNNLPSDVALTPAKDWRALGTPHHRVNGREIVTGAHQFPSDIVRPNMLYGCILRPPTYGAVLESVDLAPARKLPDVTAVRDAEFAGCAAPTSFAARKAVAALAGTAQWRTKEHPASSRLFEHLKEHAEARPREQVRGSLETGFHSARQRLKATYRAGYVQHAPMETRAAVAEWTEEKLTVWTGTSNPFSIREQLAQAFHLRPEQVRVIVPDMGGGFGGKHTGEAALEAARLAKEAGRPVSLQWTRAEEFMWAYFRPAALIEIEAGIDDAGAVVAWDFANYNSGSSALDSPYRMPNVRTRFLPCAAPLRQGSYRCLAGTANNFARESFMDELAAAAHADPLEFRLAHLDNARLREVMVAAAEHFGWRERRKKRRANTGLGLACGTEKGSVVAACVEVEVDRTTGTPWLLEICEAFECGAVLNPANLLAQVEGSIMMGLGAALREEIQFENGRLTNGSFAKYGPPRFRDLPKMEIVLLDKKDREPVGAGETPIMAVAPALGNAVFDAIGERVRMMPVRAGRNSA